MLKVGDKAPGFDESDQDGNRVKLSDYRGKKLVLYFYPKDSTPTCVNEACNLRDNYHRLLAAGYSVLGVSMDNPKSHRRFIDKYQLPFPLLSDVDRRVVDAYGLWVEKNMYGRTFMGIARTTFVIDEKGVIQEIISKVESKKHADQILTGQEPQTTVS